MKSVFNYKLTQIITGLFILMGVMIIIYPPDIEFFRRTSEFAVHLMFLLLIVSLLFLLFKQTRLMFITMLASAFLAFYLKTASNTNLTLPQDNYMPQIKVAHYNLSSLNVYDPQFKETIMASESDVISFQEYTPDWDAFISVVIQKEYPHVHKMVRIDLFGMAIYSKKPITKVETFRYNSWPNLNITVDNNHKPISLVSSYITPPSLESDDIKSKNHLFELADYIRQIGDPIITMGDFNQVYWSNEIKKFRERTNLYNSRRDISLTSKVPHDHIFYSSDFECIQFSEVKDSLQNHLGIIGTYQFTPRTSIN